MGPVKPFDLPEIRQCIARYLCIKDLTKCILVCKSWHQSFLPDIWESIEIFRPYTASDQDALIPLHSQDVLHLHNHLVNTLDIRMLAPEHYIICYPNLRNLSIAIEWREAQDALGDLTTLIHLNPTIVRLETSLLIDSIHFWTAVSEKLPHLKELRFTRTDMKDKSFGYAFWNTCIRLESLKLWDVRVPPIAAVPSMDGLIFTRIRQLALNWIHDMDVIEQLDLITRCPQLEDLVWMPWLPGDELTIRFGALGEARTWPKLASLYVKFPMQDKALASILDKTDASMRFLQLEGEEYGSPVPPFLEAFRALRRHFQTLTHFDVGGATALTSLMHQEILCSCPLLDHFVGSDFAAKDALGGGSWVCLSIRVFKAQFVVEEHEEHLHPMVFEHLSKFVRLQKLSVGLNNRKTRGLDFRLANGLGALHTLVKLHGVEVGYVQCLENEDVEWMIDHWTNLRYVFGVFNTDVTKDVALRHRFDAADISTHR